jgi:hypothetical protein
MQPVLGLARLVETDPLRVEEPAVIAAADAEVFHLAVEQRRAAVDAPWVDEARVAAAVAEQDQVFAEHPNRARKIRCLLGQRDRMPVAAQKLTARSARVHRREVVIDRSRRAAVGAAVAIRRITCGHARMVSLEMK